jgi:hypothetical protein
MTEYVATRWYRAPEVMLSFKQYTKVSISASIDKGCRMLMASGRGAVDRRLEYRMYLGGDVKRKASLPWERLVSSAWSMISADLQLNRKFVYQSPPAQLDSRCARNALYGRVLRHHLKAFERVHPCAAFPRQEVFRELVPHGQSCRH